MLTGGRAYNLILKQLDSEFQEAPELADPYKDVLANFPVRAYVPVWEEYISDANLLAIHLIIKAMQKNFEYGESDVN
jgi:hypothetical protein